MHINYLFNSKLFYVWIQEPNWQNYLLSTYDIALDQSWGTFLFQQESSRRRLMEIPSAGSLLDRSKSLYTGKLVNDDPSVDDDKIFAMMLDFSEFGNDVDLGAELAL